MRNCGNLDNVTPFSEYARPSAGGYVFKIISVEDKDSSTGKHYLNITCDIAEGEFANYGENVEARTGGTYGYKVLRAFYSENEQDSTTRAFKRFIDAVEASNANYKFKNDETTLVGKVFGAVMVDEEYIDKFGEVRVAAKINYFSTHSVADIRCGKFKVPAIKRVAKPEQRLNATEVYVDDSLPF